MMKKHPFLIPYIGYVILSFVLFVYIFPSVMASMKLKNVVYLSEKSTIVLATTGPVDVLAYSKDSKNGARIYDESGNEVLRTLPETIPGNFAAKGVLNNGVYTLKGDRTVLEFSGERFVSVKSPGEDSADAKLGWFVWLLFGLVFGLFVSAEYRTSLLHASKTEVIDEDET